GRGRFLVPAGDALRLEPAAPPAREAQAGDGMDPAVPEGVGSIERDERGIGRRPKRSRRAFRPNTRWVSRISCHETREKADGMGIEGAESPVSPELLPYAPAKY